MSGTKSVSHINTRPWKAKNYSPEASPEVRPAKTPSFLASLYISEKISLTTYSFPSHSPVLCNPMHQEEVRVGWHRSLFRFLRKELDSAQCSGLNAYTTCMTRTVTVTSIRTRFITLTCKDVLVKKKVSQRNEKSLFIDNG